jgi:S1-C subfamily serine protease
MANQLRKCPTAATTAALLTLFLSAVGAGGQEIARLHREARESVFLLRVFDASGSEIGTGTGFLAEGGVVVTNHHVIERAARVEAVLADERKVVATGIVALDPDNDLALLRFPPFEVRPLPLAPSAGLQPGERVIVLGSPLGLSLSVSDGIVAALRPQGLGPESEFTNPLLQITAPISPGSSGSPVLNAQGAVVGVAEAVLVEGQNVNLAIPSDSVRALIARSRSGGLARRLHGEAGTTSWAYLRNLGISAAVFVAIYLALRKMR